MTGHACNYCFGTDYGERNMHSQGIQCLAVTHHEDELEDSYTNMDEIGTSVERQDPGNQG